VGLEAPPPAGWFADGVGVGAMHATHAPGLLAASPGTCSMQNTVAAVAATDAALAVAGAPTPGLGPLMLLQAQVDALRAAEADTAAAAIHNAATIERLLELVRASDGVCPAPPPLPPHSVEVPASLPGTRTALPHCGSLPLLPLPSDATVFSDLRGISDSGATRPSAAFGSRSYPLVVPEAAVLPRAAAPGATAAWGTAGRGPSPLGGSWML
jgi:hypothetical protein